MVDRAGDFTLAYNSTQTIVGGWQATFFRASLTLREMKNARNTDSILA